MANVVLHRVRAGETLPSIAEDYYGSPAYAPVILNVNRDRLGANPNVLNAGAEIVLPRVGPLRAV